MTRTVQPYEILISVCIFAVLAVGIFWTGVWAGRQSDSHYDVLAHMDENLDELNARLSQDYDNPLGVTVSCRGDASDWATIRMANQMASEFDIPAFVHGNCLTHNVVDVPK